MSTRQYIGARYTPKFSGTYDATQAYEALEVVDNGSGTTYIARKPVPPNIPLTNTEYWLVYGSSSGAILDLQSRVSEIETTDIPAINSSILSIGGRVDTIENTTIPAINSRIDNINTETERNAVYFGNSYIALNSDSLFYQTKDMFNNAYYKAYDGAGFETYVNHSTTFEDLVDSAISDSTIPKDSITDIIFVVAVGDERSLQEKGISGYKTALASTLTSIKGKIAANYPNVDNIVVTLASSRNTHSFSDSYYEKSFELNILYEKMLSQYGFKYIGWIGWFIWMQDGMFQSDNYHPSATGFYKLGVVMKSAYTNGIEYPTYSSYDASFDFDYPSGSTGTLRTKVNPHHWELYFDITTLASGNITLNQVGRFALTSVKYAPPICFSNSYLEKVHEFVASLSSGVPATYLYCNVSVTNYNHLPTLVLNSYNAQTISSNNRNFIQCMNDIAEVDQTIS